MVEILWVGRGRMWHGYELTRKEFLGVFFHDQHARTESYST